MNICITSRISSSNQITIFDLYAWHILLISEIKKKNHVHVIVYVYALYKV